MHPDVTFPVLLLRHSRQPEQSRLTVLSSVLTEIDEQGGSWAADLAKKDKLILVTGIKDTGSLQNVTAKKTGASSSSSSMEPEIERFNASFLEGTRF
ncbi:hypothetical protein CEXT_20541 [Caerostris extrusa]|uniref:Uncharacterized protein n=1 Tax=Caerostris extrusa TaxID=172846 RepID=A0AAV4QQS2_CAEEX|nr:hypothetical protein CEXT_20541 [Caerostris extrusa]